MTRGVHNPTAACSVPGCSDRPRGKGMCAMHYARFKRQGHVELKGTGYGEAIGFLRANVSFTGDDCLIWPYAKNSQGYATLKTGGKICHGHRLMCKWAHGEPPTPKSVVRHKCGRGHMGCVNPKHLEWGTRTQNQLDMAKHGTIARGANSSSCKLTGRQVLEIYANTGEDNAALAARMGVSVTTLGDIRNGKSWTWLTKHGQN